MPAWRVRRRLATAGLLAGLAAAIVPVTVLNDRFDARRRAAPPERVLYLPKGDTLKFLCLGYNGLAADMVWIRSAMYVGRRLNERQAKYEWLAKLFQVTTDLDPHWKRPYRVGALLLSALPEDDERAVALLRKGLDNNPGDWEIPYRAAQLHMLRGRDREALKWLTLISRTVPDHPRVVEATRERLLLDGQDHAQALALAAQELRAGNGRVLDSVNRLNYREALARLTAAELTAWRRRCAAAGGAQPAGVEGLLAARFRPSGRGDGARELTVRDLLRMRLEPLVGDGESADYCARLPADPYGMRFHVRQDGAVGSEGLERIELGRLVRTCNFHLGKFRELSGRPARTLDELVGYWRELDRRGRLPKGLAAIVGHPPRMPAHPDGSPRGWGAVELRDGLLVMPPGPDVEQMLSAPLAMPGATPAPAR
ncbi:MAG TPA: tetratricopeptide repeat protein [Planctomycetota bacterium]|nr:tetratricopeptide repeat protein [Planctomycetota bacterium]